MPIRVVAMAACGGSPRKINAGTTIIPAPPTVVAISMERKPRRKTAREVSMPIGFYRMVQANFVGTCL
jgi:hypothetical protein